MGDLIRSSPGRLIATPQANSDAHLISMWLKGKSDRTVERYTKALERFQLWMEQQGLQELRQITAAHMLDYADSLPQRWSDATRNQYVATIKSLWTFGLSLGYLPFNVAGILSLGKPVPVLPERILTKSDVLAALAAEPYEEPALLINTLFGTGIRSEEALALTWADLTEMDNSPRVTIRKGKGNKPRVISCFASAWSALMDAKPESAGSTPVFEISYVTAYRWVKDAFERVGKRNVSPHWLRHASAAAMRQAGMDWPDIANQLGHSDPSITLKAYSHLTEAGHEAMKGL